MVNFAKEGRNKLSIYMAGLPLLLHTWYYYLISHLTVTEITITERHEINQANEIHAIQTVCDKTDKRTSK